MAVKNAKNDNRKNGAIGHSFWAPNLWSLCCGFIVEPIFLVFAPRAHPTFLVEVLYVELLKNFLISLDDFYPSARERVLHAQIQSGQGDTQLIKN